MAQGNVVSAIQSIAAGAFLDVKPVTLGVEWVIHNVYFTDAISLVIYDGTNSLVFKGPTAAGVADFFSNLQVHVTNLLWMRVQNNHATLAKLISYDGIQTA